MSAVSVDELKRAWVAVESGRFRTNAPSRQAFEPWEPAERVVAVFGVGGRVGATTVALGIAESAGLPALVVEIGTPHLSGLGAAPSAELGEDEYGWRHGTREAVRIERSAFPLTDPAQSPIPPATNCVLTVVDVGWEPSSVRAADGWIEETLSFNDIVLVAPITVPGMRALEAALADLESADDVWIAAIAPPRKRWPKRVQLAAPPHLALAETRGRLICVPPDRSLAVEGISATPLPHAVLAACRPITDTTDSHPKGRQYAAAR